MSVRPILCLIPARGGSKGLPGKNLALVGGIPLVGRAVRLARHCLRELAVKGRVIVSTDEPAIAEAALEWGAEVPFMRPPELATDTASSIDVVVHALDAIGGDADTVVLLQPTSPLTEVDDVVGAVRLHRERGVPVVSVVEVEHPIEWTYRLGESGALEPVSDAGMTTRRQDSGKLMRLNGAVYVASASWLLEHKSFVGPETLGFVMPRERSVDIDTALDLEVARAFLAGRPIKPVSIGGRLVGPGQPCFIIAEAGVNHNGATDMALRLVDAAADAGADAVKFQTFRAAAVATPAAHMAAYQARAVGAAGSQLDMLARLELSVEGHRRVAARCRERGVVFLSSPADPASADLLREIGVPAFKVGSGNLTNDPLLEYLARVGLPLIISTGMATLDEVAAAVSVVRAAGGRELVLLHCVSEYPADPAVVNLRAMVTMGETFGVPVGYSDHTLGAEVSLAAVALGACVIEKHLTLDRNLPGPDHQASLEPAQFTALVRSVRTVEACLGDGVKRPAPAEEANRAVMRKSLVAAVTIPAGTLLTPELLAVRRPGTGIAPGRRGEFVGRRSRCEIPAGTLLAPEMVE